MILGHRILLYLKHVKTTEKIRAENLRQVADHFRNSNFCT